MTQRHHPSRPLLFEILRPLTAHLFAVLAVIVIAVALSLMSGREKGETTIAEHEQLATPSATPSGNDTTLFSVVVTNDVICQNNIPLTTVGFLAVPLDGGMFHLVSSNGLDVPFFPGSYPLANGTYAWYVTPKEGLNAMGSTTGMIVLAGDCASPGDSLSEVNASSVGGSSASDPFPQTGTTTTISSLSATPSLPLLVDAIPLPRPILKLFNDNTPIVEGSKESGIIELRVSDNDVKSIQFIAMEKGGERKVVGKGVLDELLSDEDYTTWVYFWDTSSTTGEYKISAVVTHGGGVVAETVPVTLSIHSQTPLTVNSSVLSKTKIEAKNNPPPQLQLTPSTCTTQLECHDFCLSSKENHDMCMRYVTTSINSSEEGSFLDGRVGARLFIDTDDDGIRDYDEVNLYDTNPRSADSDKDGFPDSAELLGATNPRGGITTSEALSSLNGEVFSSSDSLEKIVPALSSLAILRVAVAEDESASSTPLESIVYGTGLPNAYVTLFIFSRPFTAVVQADEEGNFAYTLPRELADGTHRIYATIGATNGTPLLRSEGYVFVKRGSQVGRPSVLPVVAIQEVDVWNALVDSSLFASLFLFAGLGLFACAFWWRQRTPVPIHHHTKPLSHVIYLK